MPEQIWIYHAALTLQVAAVALYVGYITRPHRGVGFAASALLAMSGMLCVVFYGGLGLRQGRLPLASGFEALCFWALALTWIALWAEWRFRLGLMGAFLAPFSALTLLMGLRFSRIAAEPAQGLGSAFLVAHVSLSMAAYAFFTAAAAAALAYLVQERQLKRKTLGSLFYQLPPLEALERLVQTFCLAAVVCLAVGLGAGMLNEPRPSWTDPKVLFNVVVWLAYAACLWRWKQGLLKGRRFAFAAIALFVLVFFGFYLVNLYFGGHAMLRSPQVAL